MDRTFFNYKSKIYKTVSVRSQSGCLTHELGQPKKKVSRFGPKSYVIDMKQSADVFSIYYKSPIELSKFIQSSPIIIASLDI